MSVAFRVLLSYDNSANWVQLSDMQLDLRIALRLRQKLNVGLVLQVVYIL